MRDDILFVIIVICIFQILSVVYLTKFDDTNNRILTELQKHDTNTKIVCNSIPEE